MTRNLALMSILGFVVTCGELSAQANTLNNYYNQGYQVGQSVSQGGTITSAYYDPYGTGYQFPSPQFPSTQFPSISTPSTSIRGAYGPGPYGTTSTAYSTYGAPGYAAPGTPAVTYTSPYGATAVSPTPYVAPPVAPPAGTYNPYPAGYPAVTYAQPVVPTVAGVAAPAAPAIAAPIAPITGVAPAIGLPPVRAAYPTGAYGSIGGTSVGSSGSYGSSGVSAPAIQSVYPQPAVPRGSAGGAGGYIGAKVAQGGLVAQALPLEAVAPMDKYTPGLATIREGKWVVSEMLYRLPINIPVKVDIVKPQDKYTPVLDKQIEKQVKEIFRAYYIVPEPFPLPCEPELPVFQITLLSYPCDRRCVGVLTAQLYEKATPKRIDTRINGVWQLISWQRQVLVVSACEDFEQQVLNAISEIANEFGRVFKYYHNLPTKPCFDTYDRPLWVN